MCGIVGIASKRKEMEASVALSCMERLEYRGYDSAGIAVVSVDGRPSIVKGKGSTRHIADDLGARRLRGKFFVGHTRWATHGGVTDYNAHPHTDCTGKIVVVHNGIISNYAELREELKALGHPFRSETDTEVVPHMIEHLKKLGFDDFSAFKGAVQRLRGTYALLAVTGDGRIYFARKDTPLVIGIGDDGNYIASDIPAFLQFTNRILPLENGDIGFLTDERVYLERDGRAVDVGKLVKTVPWSPQVAVKGGYDFYMLKEIHESPVAVKSTIEGMLSELDRVKEVRETIMSGKRVYIIGAGTSYHAALFFSIEANRRGIPIQAVVSSEADYLADPDVVVAVSQSGETVDTLMALRHFKERGAETISITNVLDSSIARESKIRIYTRAGPEISVAATKTFMTQVASLLFLLGEREGLEKAYLKVEESINSTEGFIKELSKRIARSRDMYFLGRGSGLPLAMEGALKIKEVSYIHAEAYPAGESKHGPISLVEKDFPVVIVNQGDPRVEEHLKGNLMEMRARGAFTISVGEPMGADWEIRTPRVENSLAPFSVTPALHLLAYYTAVGRGLDPDRPRNLAKTVTVL